MNCSLCGSYTVRFTEIHNRVYHQCNNCGGISLDPSYYLNDKEEKERYEIHNNDVNDLGYQNFVSPIVNAITENYNQEHYGLDFGSGTGPVITTMLQKKGYQVNTYDPFFDPNSKALEQTYDYIACCEVMEHFHNPNKEFSLLYSLLKENGTLYCKTNVYNDSIDFDTWWYKNDPTHVFFYTGETLHWIKSKFNFSEISFSKKLISFKR
ncbi:class I SAM-dependent methyltransferase [Aquimarina litoralis]|uniref:class I SAM-dependent methyltransferase n=1 Tax=Aquimarina litoralis TaxID=584605 RepID=UPI001C55BE4B|nr:class I SAM-dependent methyltransferase [Aquimarina litoralis]MBW1298129.1 methyltransferase domain-containing protein [Aquimarina litoralis]